MVRLSSAFAIDRAMLFGLDKLALALALGVAKAAGVLDLSWWLVSAPLWAGWLLLWPLGRLTDEVLAGLGRGRG